MLKFKIWNTALIIGSLFLGCGEEYNNSSSKPLPLKENYQEKALTSNDFQDSVVGFQKILDTTAKWKNNTIKWWYNPNKQKFSNTEEAVSIFKSAMKSWSDVSGVKFEYQGVTSSNQFDMSDGKVVFGWADPSEVITYFGGDGSIGAFVRFEHDGTYMTDARMSLNTSRYTTIRSWKGLISHELGHVLGIGHSNISESVMFANPYHTTVYQETLRTDDIDAVTTLYPKEKRDIISGVFDGAGSLVSPSEVCWGCDRDEARMHPHLGVGSTVVFQFYKNRDCDHIDIRSKYDIGEVVVRSKGWNQADMTETSYKYQNLPIGDSNKNSLGGISVEATSDTASNGWTTIAVTTLNPINQTTPIYAFCRSSNDLFNYESREKINNDFVDVTYDFIWTGTGSLISRAKKLTSFGKFLDYAVPFKTTNSLTSFQWDTSNCKRVKISNGKTDILTTATVEVKDWKEDSEQWKRVCSTLPCMVTKEENAYYILKVKSSPNIISEGYIEVECVE